MRLLDGVRFQSPILAALKALDLLLALHDHPQRGRLHPAGGQAGPNFLPQQRREVEADQIVQRPPGLLGVDQIQGKLARLRHGLLNRPLGDLVEHDAPHGFVAQQIALLEDFAQVPGDGLAFPVGVGRQIERVRLGGGLGDGLDVPLVFIDELVFHGEAALGIDRAFLGHQIAHVAVGGQNLVIRAQIFFDRLGLGGRFDDDQIFTHVFGMDDGGGRASTGQDPPRRIRERGANGALEV